MSKDNFYKRMYLSEHLNNAIRAEVQLFYDKVITNKNFRKLSTKEKIQVINLLPVAMVSAISIAALAGEYKPNKSKRKRN